MKVINAIRTWCMISVETGRRGIAQFLAQHVMVLGTFESTRMYKCFARSFWLEDKKETIYDVDRICGELQM